MSRQPDGIAAFRQPLPAALSPAASSKADDASSIENAKLHRLDRDEDVLRFLRDHFARQVPIRFCFQCSAIELLSLLF